MELMPLDIIIDEGEVNELKKKLTESQADVDHHLEKLNKIRNNVKLYINKIVEMEEHERRLECS